LPSLQGAVRPSLCGSAINAANLFTSVSFRDLSRRHARSDKYHATRGLEQSDRFTSLPERHGHRCKTLGCALYCE